MKTKPLQVGITGGIGSGKSTICKVFRHLGIPIYTSDEGAKWVLDHHPEVKKEIIAYFGENAYTEAGVNKGYLAQEIFHNQTKLEVINNIVHPRVAQHYASWYQSQKSVPYVIREAAIMIESGANKLLDKLITVFTPEAIRLQRTLKRDTFRKPGEVEAIMQKQITEEEKIRQADYIIYNDDQQLVLPQILHIHQILLNLG